MQTSRNPKVIDKVLQYKLRPVLDKISQLEVIGKDNADYINNITSRLGIIKEKATEELNEYELASAKLDNTISKSNKNLSNLIKNTLYNPNLSTNGTGSGTDLTEQEETKLITDKTIDAGIYGLVKEGLDYSLFGITGKGIVINDDSSVIDKEFEWRNPSNKEHAFPSYYINDMVAIDTSNVLIATNNGVVSYNIIDESFSLMDKSYGLPNSIVHKIVKLQTSDKVFRGYLALTEKGIAFSSDAKMWNAIDPEFTEVCVSASKTDLINTPQEIVFIGTSKGIYYFDVDNFINNDIRTVKEIPGLNLLLPSIYINGIAYDTHNDTLAIVSMSGLNTVKNVKDLISSGKTVTSSLKNANGVQYYNQYNTVSGLNTTSCYDCIYTIDDKLIICTSNGLNITENYTEFKSITKTVNNYNGSDELLNSFICNKIIRKSSNKYTILHSVGITEDITI